MSFLNAPPRSAAFACWIDFSWDRDGDVDDESNDFLASFVCLDTRASNAHCRER